MPTGQTDRQTPGRYITFAARRDQREKFITKLKLKLKLKLYLKHIQN